MHFGLTSLACPSPPHPQDAPDGSGYFTYLFPSLPASPFPLPHRAPPGAGFGYYTYRGSYPRYDDPYDEDGDEYATYSDDEYY